MALLFLLVLHGGCLLQVVRWLMAEFKTPLVVRLLPECPDIEQWQLVEPLIYDSDILGRIVVPIDFITNFVSFKPLNYLAHRPATIHDYLSSCSDVEIEVANRVFKEAMDSIKLNSALAEEMYEVVCVTGKFFKTCDYKLREG
jgi:hypothetical protein